MAMQPISPRGRHRPKQLLRRFDRTISQINPFLLAIAFGLAVLNITCLFALAIRAPVGYLHACVRTPATSDATDNQLK
jgi:hypothetical protein